MSCFFVIASIKRHQLEDHLSLKYSLQAITCEFQHPGCDAKFIHKDQAKHLKDEMQKHLSCVVKVEESSRQSLNRNVLELNDSVWISADINELNVEVKRNATCSRLALDLTINNGQAKINVLMRTWTFILVGANSVPNTHIYRPTCSEFLTRVMIILLFTTNVN